MDEVESYEAKSSNVSMLFSIFLYFCQLFVSYYLYAFFLKLAPKPTMGINSIVLDRCKIWGCFLDSVKVC